MIKIIPQPNLIEVGKSRSFYFSDKTVIKATETIIELYQREINSLLTEIKQDMAINNEINIQVSPNLSAEEYRITVDDKEINITGGSLSGIFYSFQTLKQVIIQSGAAIPELKITDKPLYNYRGFMLDTGRYFFKVEDVKKIIDMMALHKLNVFHWHLTEDQGWRVEIKKYPRLTTYGSKRSHTNFGIIPHRGFYTRKDIRDVVEYAHRKSMIVIPEIDMPGHMVSAIACYSYLSCFDRRIKVATHWGVKHDILCAGKESTYKFIYDVIDELTDLFPDKYFHIGGDEAVKTRWKLCKHCQHKIRELGLSDEEELQQYFMSKISRYLKTRNKTAIIWNEALEKTPHLLDKDIVWQLYQVDERTEKTIIKELEDGRKMINSLSFPYYLDLPYAWNNLKKVYNFKPEIKIQIDAEIPLLGIEAPLWTEYVPHMRKANYMLYPRIGAVSEIAWSQIKDRDYDRFLDKLDTYYRMLDFYGLNYALPHHANPGKIRSRGESLWFNRRPLHWHGLHNLIDNALVKYKAKQK